MIYYDSSEVNTRLPQKVIDYGRKYPDLEKLTGADFLVIPEIGNYEKATELQEKGKNLTDIGKELGLNLMQTIEALDAEKALHNWLFAGAILVQRKSGQDFLHSMGERLNTAIARMCEVSQKQYQKIILVTGIFSRQGDKLTLDGKITDWNYASFLGATSAIKYKGASIDYIPNDDTILEWVKIQEQQMLKYKRDNTKWIISPVYYPPDLPELDDPLQLMIPVRDGRLALVCIPGWGSEKTNTLQEYVKQCLQINTSPSLYHLLHYATSWETAKHCKGIGNVLIKNAREYVGLGEGEYLAISSGNLTVQKES